ncbi:hypothetical protein NHH03_25840 [Stieleria sp. TO1_6]|uniref:hypothetical protein n=1 Tax=Stieleria tagensis TaxID=2956795 RepID=UPI00209ADD29|nr:hypothetical protein [Stieleria tagensis]MCO8125185.1 hypothetical protein [Stieleria tagensis]
MAQKQLALKFETESQDYRVGHPLSKQDFIDRTRNCFNLCSYWLEGWLPAYEFWAGGLGVYDQTECESIGTFSDADQVKLLHHDWTIAANTAIAIELASQMIEEQGHPKECRALVRSFYLAIGFQELGLDYEQLMPGMPVHVPIGN